MSKFQVPLAISSTRLTIMEFWSAVILYHDRPHLVNRKILAASQCLFYRALLPERDIDKFTEVFTRSSILYEMRQLKSVTKDNITENFIRNIVDCYYKNFELIESSESDFAESHTGLFVSIRILLPRNKVSTNSVEVVLFNKPKNSAIFLAVTELDKLPCAPPFPYQIELNDNLNLRISLNSFEDADTASAEWLAIHLFSKLLKWSKEENKVGVKSLSLISMDNYGLVYNRLKQQYAEELIQKWPSKTTTNPQKYVYEDLAIACYLICLWNHFNKSDISFVDCGCGNGLLVFILNQEGYKGYGIDIRRRAIWDIYSDDTVLQIDTVSPDSRFTNSTWIIGNHSDELTPWIPVIALKSSPKTNYFVLPCCPHDFSGQKYIRENTGVSQYSDYLSYIERISKKCGFDTKIDKLRIPSTKRVCLVGYANASPVSRDSLIKEIDEFIDKRSRNVFVVRNNVEEVRNCTKLSKSLLQKVVCDIVQLLLTQGKCIKKSNGGKWNKGSSVTISSICQSLNKEDLKKLKNECGGVQTLLKNHRYLFVVDKGMVELRLPYKFADVGEKYRTKPCWYYRNHEHGCLLNAEECAYVH